MSGGFSDIGAALDCQTSLQVFSALREMVRDGMEVEGGKVDASDALGLVAMVCIVCSILENRGVLADVEQYLTGLYENTRGPGYAGTSKPLERAARDAAEGVQP